jgi:hypothetical protein
MVAILTRIFGLEHLSLAEDVVQEAWDAHCKPGLVTAFQRIHPRG